MRWFAHDGLFQVTESGLVTGGERLGEDTLTAEVTEPNGTTRGIKEILVLHDGTYRMLGVVTESVPPHAAVNGARVEVASAPPLAATTDWDGRYVLFGVPGNADIRVTREGYQPHVERLQLTAHSKQDFQLILSGSRLSLAGAYTLSLDAACATSTPVDEALRHPRYDAAVTQNGADVQVVLTDSLRFRVNAVGRGDRFGGRVDATGANFNLGQNFYRYYPSGYDPLSYPNIVERIADGSYLVIDGQATTRISPAGLSGEFQGFFLHHASTFPGWPLRTFGTCYSSVHRFTLVRR